MIDEYRKQSKWHGLETELVDESENSAIKSLVNQDRLQAFKLALASLPFLQKEALILQQEGFRLREISLITNTELETVKTRLRYAKQHLKVVVHSEEIQ